VENLVDALEATLRVLREAAEEGFRPEELERYKEGARCGMEMLCDRATRLADWFGRQELLQGPGRVLTPQQYVERQEDLTLEALGAVMREVSAEHGVVLVVVGPFGDEEQGQLQELFPANVMESVSAGATSEREGETER
jgi:predicted Zn-dependent peptidase